MARRVGESEGEAGQSGGSGGEHAGEIICVVCVQDRGGRKMQTSAAHLRSGDEADRLRRHHDGGEVIAIVLLDVDGADALGHHALDVLLGAVALVLTAANLERERVLEEVEIRSGDARNLLLCVGVHARGMGIRARRGGDEGGMPGAAWSQGEGAWSALTAAWGVALLVRPPLPRMKAASSLVILSTSTSDILAVCPARGGTAR